MFSLAFKMWRTRHVQRCSLDFEWCRTCEGGTAYYWLPLVVDLDLLAMLFFMSGRKLGAW